MSPRSFVHNKATVLLLNSQDHKFPIVQTIFLAWDFIVHCFKPLRPYCIDHKVHKNRVEHSVYRPNSLYCIIYGLTIGMNCDSFQRLVKFQFILLRGFCLIWWSLIIEYLVGTVHIRRNGFWETPRLKWNHLGTIVWKWIVLKFERFQLKDLLVNDKLSYALAPLWGITRVHHQLDLCLELIIHPTLRATKRCLWCSYQVKTFLSIVFRLSARKIILRTCIRESR